MNSRIIKVALFSLFLLMLAADADAQRASRRRTTTPTTTPQNAQGQTQEQNNNTAPPSGYNPYGNIPIQVDTTSSQGAVQKSLRTDAIVDKSLVNDRTPLPYEHLRWDDALFLEKVWRELDLREKMNQTFRYEGEDDNGSGMFIDIILKALKQDTLTAFADDRFSVPLTSAELSSQTEGGQADTSAVYNIDDPSKIDRYVVTRTAFDPKSITKIRLKEEWVFDREASRMFVRIIGIAPVRTVMRGNREQSNVMFWIYYPDLRKALARHEVYNPKNLGYGRMTWEELFEARMFSSYITKSTLDNAGNKTIRQMIKDPILALLEGENIKERIFNYEQDLWSY
ncbi:MAG TPA: gliding motility protein GldN [Flavisolibacter sp.]|nr:gliding motility protein GldN [Flavisolibacter sp.]